jgi:hypothetical protein
MRPEDWAALLLVGTVATATVTLIAAAIALLT